MTNGFFDSDYISGLWERAVDTLRDAKLVISPHSIANRSYYAAFYAVTALFALEGVSFKKHSQLEAAVHRDLVHTERWDARLGKNFSDLIKYRTTGDYRFNEMVSPEEAKDAIKLAFEILEAVHEAGPDIFPMPV